MSGNGYSSFGRCDIIDSQSCEGTQSDLKTVAQIAALCNNASIASDGVLRGQPTEGALLNLAAKITPEDFRAKFNRIKEVPFSSETKTMTVVCQVSESRVVFVILLTM